MGWVGERCMVIGDQRLGFGEGVVWVWVWDGGGGWGGEAVWGGMG